MKLWSFITWLLHWETKTDKPVRYSKLDWADHMTDSEMKRELRFNTFMVTSFAGFFIWCVVQFCWKMLGFLIIN